MTLRDIIDNINEIAQENFDRAAGMLEMFNEIYNTKLEWYNKRVVYYESPMGIRRDAWANL